MRKLLLIALAVFTIMSCDKSVQASSEERLQEVKKVFPDSNVYALYPKSSREFLVTKPNGEILEVITGSFSTPNVTSVKFYIKLN